MPKAHCQYAGALSAAYPGYPKFYNSITASIASTYPANNSLWAPVTQLVNASGQNVKLSPAGLMVIDPYGTGGPGGVSESMGYMMILAALYNDQNTFDKLSYTIQAGGASGSNKLGGLFNWYWVQSPAGSSTFTAYNFGPSNGYAAAYACDSGNPVNSAGDADINIAIAYMMASWAVTTYGWSYYPTIGGQPSYYDMATNYIKAIRTHDFIQKLDSTAPYGNLYILADGMQQAAQYYQFTSGANWHPDYSDPRAYQLFSMFDTEGATFWNNAITATITSWKSLYLFSNGSSYDPRTEGLGTGQNGGAIQPATYATRLQGATLQGLRLNSMTDYTQTVAYRGGNYPQIYLADCARMPMRVSEWVCADQNSANYANDPVVGIFASLDTALGVAFDVYQTNPDLQNVGCAPWDDSYNGMPIYPSPYRSSISGTSDFLAAGAWMAACRWASTETPLTSLLASSNYFGSDGTGLSVFNDGIFAPALTLWGLTTAYYNAYSPAKVTPLVMAYNGYNSTTVAMVQTAPTATVRVSYERKIPLKNARLVGGTVIDKKTKARVAGKWRWANPNEVDVVRQPGTHVVMFVPEKKNYSPVYKKIKISYRK